MRTIYFVLLIIMPIIFTVQTVMYGKLFYWRRSFQGRALMGQISSLAIVLWLNLFFLISGSIGRELQEWMILVACIVLLGLAVSSVWFTRAILCSREKPPHSSFNA